MSHQSSVRAIGFRDLLRDVNLRDFADMVLGEVRLVGEAAGASLRTAPLTFPFVLMAVLIRFALLMAVLIVFGAAITIVTLVRAPIRWLDRRRPTEG
jgi:hypothetical protein